MNPEDKERRNIGNRLCMGTKLDHTHGLPLAWALFLKRQLRQVKSWLNFYFYFFKGT